ncbi:MAG: replication protein RepA, partial [Janthinobacterium lividum]
VLVHGREAAREMVPERQRSLVNIAAEVLADETQAMGISYAGFCLTSLPHKRLADDQVWQKKGHKVTLLIEPGHMMKRGKAQPVLHGVPYGARARMILLFLQTQAVRTGSREVELGRSMSAWMGRMGIAWGGETAKAMREQAARISACSLKFFWEDETDEGWARGGILSSGLRFSSPDGSGQGRLWEERVTLDETFYRALCDHPVPLQEAAIRELRDRSMSLDLYVWMAWRMHTLQKLTPISWIALHAQFGGGFREIRHFRPRFIESLAAAVAAYPQAKVDVSETGITLHPSQPPIAKRA